MLGLGSALVSCGPPPLPLHANVAYTETCRSVPAEMRPGCPGSAWVFVGGLREGNPPLDVSCTVSPDMTRVRFRVARGTGLSFAENPGIFVVGTVAGNVPNASLRDGCADVHFQGAQSDGNPIPGAVSSNGRGCDVRINALSIDSSGTRANISGRIRCVDLPDTSVPARYHQVGTSDPMTDPEYGSFEFISCTVGQIAQMCTG